MEPLPPPLHGDQDRGSALLAMWWTELSICIVMVTMRVYSRYKLKNIGVDDWFIVAALILFISSTICGTFNATHGGGRHLYFLKPAERVYASKVTWIENLLGIMSLTTAKMSVAFLILRLVGPSTFWRKWSLYTSIGLIFIGALASILTFVQCSPPRALWEGPQNVPGAKCWNPKSQSDFAIFTGIYYTFIDFLFALLPITFVWNLNLKPQRKVALSILLSLGVLAGVCSAIKVAYLHELSARADFTWSTYDLAAWTGAEIFLLIVCACIPTLKPLYDLAREHSRFSLSYFSFGKYGSGRKNYHGFDDSAKKLSYQEHSDSSRNRGVEGRGEDRERIVVAGQNDVELNSWGRGIGMR